MAERDRKAGERSAEEAQDQHTTAAVRTPTDGNRRTDNSGGYVSYDPGPDTEGLSARHGIDVADGEAQRLQRLEEEFGSDRVQRWAEEGMPVEAMGKPRDMEAFRARQEGTAQEAKDSPSEGGPANSRAASKDRGSAQESGPQVPEAVRNVVSSSGESLDDSVQREMETKMGGDFGGVEVHTGPDAAAAADAINARAFTVGNNVAFNRGEYEPDSESGKEVLAHELTHVRQQNGGNVSTLPEAGAESPSADAQGGAGIQIQPRLDVSSPDDPAEKEAKQVAERVVAMDAPAGHGAAGHGAAKNGTPGHGAGGEPASGAREKRAHNPDVGSSVRQVAGERVQRGIFSDAASAVGEAAESAAESVKEAGKSVAESAGQAVNAIAEGASDLGEQAWNMLEKGGEEVWNALQKNGKAVANMIRNGGQRAWNILQQGGRRVWDVVQNAGGQVWSILKNSGQQLWSLLQNNTQFLLNLVQSGSQRAWSILQQGGRQLWNVVQNSGQQLWAALQGTGQQLWSLLQTNTQFLVNMIRNGGQRAWNILRGGGQQLWSVLQNSGGQVWSILRNAGQRFWNLVRSDDEFFLNMIRNGGQRVWDILADAGHQLWGVIQSSGQQIWGILRSRGQQFWNLLSRNGQLLMNMIRNGGQRAWNILRNGGQRVWQVLQNAGRQVWNVLQATGQRLWNLLEQNTALLVQMIRNGGQRAWNILQQGGQQLWNVVQSTGRRIWSALLSTGQRLWDLLAGNAAFLLGVLRNGGQRLLDVLERNARRFWTLLTNVAADVGNALLSAGRVLIDFLSRGLNRLRDFLVTVGKPALLVLKTYGEQFLYYVRKLPERVIRLGKALDPRRVVAFFEWLWEGLKQLISDPSGMEEWLASGTEGQKPAGILASIVDLTRAAEAWAVISTLFRGGRQPTGGEKSTVKSVLGDTITYESVRIVEGSSLSDRAFVTGHVINLPPGDDDMKTLVHEFVHVGQYEAVGSQYIPQAIHAQNSDMGYNYRLQDLENQSFKSFNREQQASILEDYYAYVDGGGGSKGGGAKLRVEKEISRSGKKIGSRKKYFQNYGELYKDGEGPYERLRNEYLSGSL